MVTGDPEIKRITRDQEVRSIFQSSLLL